VYVFWVSLFSFFGFQGHWQTETFTRIYLKLLAVKEKLQLTVKLHCTL
jgi:hypothetical protein